MIQSIMMVFGELAQGNLFGTNQIQESQAVAQSKAFHQLFAA
jgi:hypothetical protein